MFALYNFNLYKGIIVISVSLCQRSHFLRYHYGIDTLSLWYIYGIIMVYIRYHYGIDTLS